LYQLFIDESGHVQEYHEGIHNDPEHRYFILAGLVVKENDKRNLENAVRNVIVQHFNGIELPNNFKLSYHNLRQCKKPPYDQLDKKTKIKIADEMFSAIANLNCSLLSCRLDLKFIYEQYSNRIPQRVLALCFISERFQYFLHENSNNGEIVHEYVTSQLNKEMQTNYGGLFQTYHLPRTVSFNNINVKIKFARVRQEPILQFSDFFAYSVLIRAKTFGQKQTRWKSISSKYYNLNHVIQFRRGNCSM